MSQEQLALLVHDLNNGLLVAQANVEAARMAPEPDDRALGDAQVALERMRVMLSQFLDLYRFEDVGGGARREPALLSDLVRVASRVVPNEGEDYRLVVEASAERCNVDINLVDRAIANLLMNAVRYVNRGGVVKVTARVDNAPEGRQTVIDVGNSGPPPDEALIPTLFDKFAMGASGRHGLGLYFCRCVAEAHGGSIEFRSLPDLPANFRMILPDQ